MFQIKELRAINEVFKRLNNLQRWTTSITENKYNELSKQAFNNCICYFLAVEAEAKGKPIIWERFPKIAIYRAFEKAYVNYDTPESILKEICKMGNLAYETVFKKVVFETIVEKTNLTVGNYLQDGLGTYEEKIYKAATKIASLLEAKEIKLKSNDDGVQYDEILTSIKELEEYIPEKFSPITSTRPDVFTFFKAISNLRNQNRWAAYSYPVNCSVLGHLFDTAIFAYLAAIEKGETEEMATKMFYVGLFHDIPEAYTKDIPSTVKDKIEGFRELTEEYEQKMMAKHVYPVLPKNSKKALNSVMYELPEQVDIKRALKGADYMSAVSEIWRQFKAGTRDDSLLKAMLGHEKKFDTVADVPPNQRNLFNEMSDYVNKLKI